MTLLFLALACILFVAWLALLLLSDTSDAMTDEPTLNTRGKDR